MKIKTIISYCSLDSRFIHHCIREAKKFSNSIIVSYCLNLLDGSEEDLNIIANDMVDNDSQWFLYDYNINKTQRDHHNLARWYGYFRAYPFPPDSNDWILFLDADEIVEGDRFLEWMNKIDSSSFKSFSFLCNWYFRSEKYRSNTNERCGLLVRADEITHGRMFTDRERYVFESIPIHIPNVPGIDGRPMFHHYSWVRTKEEMIKKTRSWGHARDKDWKSLIEEEFSRPFNGKSFVHGYTHSEIKPIFNIGL